MDLSEIQQLIGPDQPKFRARQIYQAIYHQGINDVAEITTLPLAVRRELEASTSMGLPIEEKLYQSADGARRYLLRLNDGRSIESVLMPEKGRNTICISTQVGCPADCKFCLTALMGLERNLTAGEIVGQVLLLARKNSISLSEGRINVVMMGQGEPLFNLPNVLKATRLLTDPDGIGLSSKRITLSTVGIIPGIKELGRSEIRPKLAVSLNASTQTQRQKLMPVARKYRLRDLIEACQNYPLRPWEKLTFEYVLIKDVNDTSTDARQLVKLLAHLNCKVNLIPLNPGEGIPFETPSMEQVTLFQGILRRSFPCFIRKPRGLDIFAACGQLKRIAVSQSPSEPLGGGT